MHCSYRGHRASRLLALNPPSVSFGGLGAARNEQDVLFSLRETCYLISWHWLSQLKTGGGLSLISAAPLAIANHRQEALGPIHTLLSAKGPMVAAAFLLR